MLIYISDLSTGLQITDQNSFILQLTNTED